MFHFNNVVITAKVYAKPTYGTFGNGGRYANLRLLMSRTVTNKSGREDKPIFIDATAWDKVADYVNENIDKNAFVLIDGRLDMQNWRSKIGEQKSKLVIQVKSLIRIYDKPYERRESNDYPGEYPEEDEMASTGYPVEDDPPLQNVQKKSAQGSNDEPMYDVAPF